MNTQSAQHIINKYILHTIAAAHHHLEQTKVSKV